MESGELNNLGRSLGHGIHKSELSIGQPRRVRDKANRNFVSAQACLGACPRNRNGERKESKRRSLREMIAQMLPVRFQMFQMWTFHLNTGTRS